MAHTADNGLEALRAIQTDFHAFIVNQVHATEADTRVKLIDRILRDVLGWQENDITREDKAGTGHSDYHLHVRSSPLVVVEAKREGVAFTLPHNARNRSSKLNGALITDKNVSHAIAQVRGYCDDNGIKFAVATNGDAWIVFRAIRDDMPWREGRARVFPTLNFIATHFTEFWNLLSFESVRSGSLDSEFGRASAPSRQLLRVIDQLYNANLTLRRNRLNSQLQPLIRYIFEDIASQNNIDLFQNCYIHSNSLHVVADDLNVVIEDSIPATLLNLGTLPIDQTEHEAGVFGADLERAMDAKLGDLYLLLGGIGSGKTTFIRRYEMILAKELLENKCFVFHVDFLKAPLNSNEMEDFVWRTIIKSLRRDYAAHDIERRKYVKTIFKSSLAVLGTTALRGVRENTEEYESAISPHLARWQEDLTNYVPGLLKFIGLLKRRAILLIVDNVDQLAPDYQAKIFLLAQRVTRLAGSITVIALREESYYTPSIQRAFTAYSSHKFHIASPQFRAMIGNRVEYAIQAIERGDVTLSDVVFHGRTFDANDIAQFLRIVQTSLLAWSRRISLFVECICFGNMRAALEMFSTFLVSGATNVDKMLTIFRFNGSYTVAFHEFLKSVMLQDRAYYKETESPILNLYNCTAEKNSSHFTALRLLAVLLARRSETTPEGQGYVDLGKLIGMFADAFDNTSDVTTTLDRLVARQLVETNSRSTQTISQASHVRVTSAGWYYMRELSSTFAYLDLVLQDTPINDTRIESELRESVHEVNNLSDRDEEKIQRMTVRFNRTSAFLNYLATEERTEVDRFGINMLIQPLSLVFCPTLIRDFESQRDYIVSRLQAGRDADMPNVPGCTDSRMETALSAFDKDLMVAAADDGPDSKTSSP